MRDGRCVAGSVGPGPDFDVSEAAHYGCNCDDVGILRKLAEARYELAELRAAPGAGLVVCEYLLLEGDNDRGIAEVTLKRMRQRDGSIKWAVYRHGQCLNEEGDFEYEPLPSGRTDDFLSRCRLPSIAAAVERWERFKSCWDHYPPEPPFQKKPNLPP